jgi:hypothetical protein
LIALGIELGIVYRLGANLWAINADQRRWDCSVLSLETVSENLFIACSFAAQFEFFAKFFIFGLEIS